MARKPKCEKADDTHQDRHTLERLHPECAAGQPPGRQASESPARLNGLVPSEAIFHAVVDHIPDAVSIYDSALRLQYVNAAGCRLCDRPLSDFVGKREEEVWPEDVYKHYVPHLREAVRTKTPQRFETTLTFPNGRSCSQAVAYVPLLDDAGGLVHVMGITFDIKDRTRAGE